MFTRVTSRWYTGKYLFCTSYDKHHIIFEHQVQQYNKQITISGITATITHHRDSIRLTHRMKKTHNRDPFVPLSHCQWGLGGIWDETHLEVFHCHYTLVVRFGRDLEWKLCGGFSLSLYSGSEAWMGSGMKTIWWFFIALILWYSGLGGIWMKPI